VITDNTCWKECSVFFGKNHPDKPGDDEVGRMREKCKEAIRADMEVDESTWSEALFIRPSLDGGFLGWCLTLSALGKNSKTEPQLRIPKDHYKPLG
jgi:hypothetical protein